MKRVSGAAIILALILMSWWWFSPTQIIKRRVASLIDTVQVPTGMSEIGRKSRGAHLADHLAASLEIHPPKHFFQTLPASLKRDSAAAGYAFFATTVRRISLEDLEFDQIDRDGNRAHVVFHLDAIVEMPSVTPVDGILHFDTQWILDPDLGWVMRSIQWHQTGRQ
ncbi:hypothetical protein HNR46_000737 [Haloferula luteola]|uniref:DUF4864 domain-containing protein n=1 Tax=Haloferula luteola TaxID=595692 RepID=A0A840V9Q5_9BACT|nr:hypothetical protein [Haloferula luteola]MBB5350509.1 hypothetical protein [Haloferula luteola]